MQPYLTRGTMRDRFWLMVLALASVGEGVVYLASLSFVSVNWRAHVLFTLMPDDM